jgi:prepilin-type processing-associated H-X9-DG protein
MGYAFYGYNAYGASRWLSQDPLGLGGIRPVPTNYVVRPVRESEVLRPVEMIALGDAFRGDGGTILDGGWGLWRRRGLDDTTGSTERAYARHQGKAVTAFCDGHVAPQSLKALFVETNSAALLISP